MESKRITVTCTCGKEIAVPIGTMMRSLRKVEPTKEFMQKISRMSRKKKII